MVTIFNNVFSKQPYYVDVDVALQRIKDGKSRIKIEEIRTQISKERADNLKANLPSVCYSGKFEANRTDKDLIEHSGFMVLDFDEVEDLRVRQSEIISSPFVYACWISPRANGLKALIKIAKGDKHREHFAALRDIFTDADKSGVNVSRVCYESYDPEIYINTSATTFTKIKVVERIEVKEQIENEDDIFDKILKWLSNRGDAFVTGERNTFVYKMASACCRFGISKDNCFTLLNNKFLTTDNSFSSSECERTVQSAYRANIKGTAKFERDVLVDSVTRKEVQIEDSTIDLTERAKDVIFGEDVKKDAIRIYESGYASVDPIGIPEIDFIFKFKRGEITCLTGIGNYGKSTFFKYLILLRVIVYGNKFAFFSPEDNPPEEFYHDFVEVLLGMDCTPKNQRKPKREVYEAAYDFISKYIFYLYPKDISPTPSYIKERFLELIIKENVDGVVIDPFNQMANEYEKKAGRSDKYLETLLSDFSRFAQSNNVFFTIIAHPKQLAKAGDGSYPCPDVFDLADGAMWNNKMDNILVYHRPNHQKDPGSPICEFHSKKIRRQKTVGMKGSTQFEMVRIHRRYFFNGVDYLQLEMNKRNMDLFKTERQLNFSEQFEEMGGF